MTDQQHPITPPPELVEQWYDAIDNSSTSWKQELATQAVRWGADQELEACCEWVRSSVFIDLDGHDALRAARRPKPPSLAEQALEACERSAFGIPGDRVTIRRALERLQELESNG